VAGNKAAVMKFEDATSFALQIGALRFANRMVGVGQNVALGDHWLPQRRQYAGIEFAPTGTAATAATIICSRIAVEPRRDCSKFLAH
jgi:hypothetical protein